MGLWRRGIVGNSGKQLWFRPSRLFDNAFGARVEALELHGSMRALRGYKGSDFDDAQTLTSSDAGIKRAKAPGLDGHSMTEKVPARNLGPSSTGANGSHDANHRRLDRRRISEVCFGGRSQSHLASMRARGLRKLVSRGA